MKENKTFEDLMILWDIQDQINKNAIRTPSPKSWQKIFAKIFKEKK